MQKFIEYFLYMFFKKSLILKDLIGKETMWTSKYSRLYALEWNNVVEDETGILCVHSLFCEVRKCFITTVLFDLSRKD